MAEDNVMNSVIEGSINFAAELYREVTKVNPNDNVFISPLSLSTVLSMTLAGAREGTESEMAKVLGVADIEKETLHLSYKNILLSLAGVANIANRIFVQHDYHVRPLFMESLSKNYNSGCTKLDFSDSSAVSTINEWVKRETSNKIETLVQALSADTAMIIANAIYFKSLWKNQFKPSNTQVQDFHLNEEESVNVNMMYQSERFGLSFHEPTNTEVLELPHNNGKTSMLIFLPQDAASFKLFEEQFGTVLLKEVLSIMTVRKVKVFLPAFKLEESYMMKEVFVSLGMADLFSPGKANLSGISESNNLYASQVVHKTFIEVNEEGTEAAAVSGMILMKRSLEMNPTFRADRPFVFCILERSSGHVLFLGRLANPRAVPGHAHQEL